MSESLTPADLAELHRRRQEETLLKMMDERIERKICDVWDIRWAGDGSHWDKLRAMREELNDLRERAKTRSGLLAAAGTTLRDKLMAAVYGILFAAGGAWLARRFGINLPGAGP